MTDTRIIRKERRLASPPEGMRQAWVEWQVVRGRKVLSRHDTEAQAVAAKKAMERLP